jgi:hypothetical protein
MSTSAAIHHSADWPEGEAGRLLDLIAQELRFRAHFEGAEGIGHCTYATCVRQLLQFAGSEAALARYMTMAARAAEGRP